MAASSSPGSALNVHPKVAAASLGGWLTTLVLYGLHRWAGVDPPAEVGAAVLGLVTFVCGYLAPNGGA